MIQNVEDKFKKWQDEVFSGEQGQYQFLAGKQLALVVSLGQSLARYQSGGSEHYAMSEIHLNNCIIGSP